MKIHIFSVILIIALCGCNNVVKQPIIDYNKNSYDNINFTNSLKKKQSEQTVVLINNRNKSLESFDSLIKKNKIETFKVINVFIWKN